MSTEACPGCGHLLERLDGPTHRYIGASAACWSVYAATTAGGFRLPPSPYSQSLVDIYCVQHPGVESPQAKQSMAVHALALHGALVRGLTADRLIQARIAAVEAQRLGRVAYEWRDDWPRSWSETLHDVLDGRADLETMMKHTYREVEKRWGDRIDAWYDALW